MPLELIFMYMPVGLIAGILAGLLGVGGGLVIVPMLVFCFVYQGVEQAVIMHLALGTSLASIIFTSVSSSSGVRLTGGLYAALYLAFWLGRIWEHWLPQDCPLTF